ncbi:MarR family winged helix-turn-helix transcriptional regulator [Aquabacterium soli]|jgi:DNA-binding MarR family transcriptional regulator|nr:MarR family transcriptional regulator [Aquabacterium soli]
MELEDHVFFLCTQVVYRRDRLMQEVLKPVGLLSTEYRVLSAVLRKGPLPMQDLAQWTAYERTRVTHILHGMEDKGWVERTSSDSDRRAVLVRIAPKGAALFKKAKAEVDKITDQILAEHSEEDIAHLRRTLRALRGKLIEMEG